MKRFLKTISISFAVILLSGSAGFSKNNDKEKEEGDLTEIRNQLYKQIDFPHSLKKPDMNERVSITFQIGKDGKLRVLHVTSENNELTDYVIQKVGSINIVSKEEDRNKIFKINVIFKVL
jgi:hypothetical protein